MIFVSVEENDLLANIKTSKEKEPKEQGLGAPTLRSEPRHFIRVIYFLFRHIF